MEQDIKHIIQDAIHAPSGENCQPWRFTISGTTINLFNLPERDQSLYNYGQSGSYISHGAVIENIKISALQFGYFATVKLFPEKKNKNHVASLILEKVSSRGSVLYDSIKKRVTNRKPYGNAPLSESELSELLKNVEEEGVRILITQEESDKKILGKIGGFNESVMISNRFLHNFFFSHVTWTKEEDQKKKVGFFIDTLELPLPAKKMFKLIKNWRIANLLNKIGLYKMVGSQNAKTYVSSSGFGILLTKHTLPEDFVYAGMALERVWLKATNLGLNFQPVSGLLFLSQTIQSGGTKEFTKNQIQTLQTGHETIKKIFSIGTDEHVVFMFRFGRGEKPTAKSLRFNVEDFIQAM